MKVQKILITSLVAAGFGFAYAPKSEAVLAAYVHIMKDETPDTRFHLGEVEAFSAGNTPDDLGGGTFGGFSTSTNDIGDGILGTFGDGNLFPVFGTTTALEHGGANKNPNNVLESAGAVWSTANTIGSNAQYTLDLGGTFDVTAVRAWARADGCCGHRWNNVSIQLLDASQNPIPGTQTTGLGGGTNGGLEVTYAAVPEPSGVALLGLAASALFFRRRR